MKQVVNDLRLNLKGQKRPCDLSFDGPQISSDGGAILLKSIDDEAGISDRISMSLHDDRDMAKVSHTRKEQVAQRIYQICLGYENQNDADFLRDDPILKMCCGLKPNGDSHLSCQSSLSRFENSVEPNHLMALLHDFENEYVDRLSKDQKEVILDIDTSSCPTYGGQQLTLFHGYYKTYMYHPVFVFDGRSGEIISLLLRGGTTHASRGAVGILTRLIRKIRKKCLQTKIIIRGDGGFCVPKLHERLDQLNCELKHVEYVFGLATNKVLQKLSKAQKEEAASSYEESGVNVRHFHEFNYAAQTWSKERRVIAKSEHNSHGSNQRFIVTNVAYGSAEERYDYYCERGQAENYIKDLKNAMYAGRLSCTTYAANSFRLLLHGWAYRIMIRLRERAKKCNLEVGRLQFDTLRLRLLKVAAQTLESVRRIKVVLPSVFPLAAAFQQILLSSTQQPQ